MQDHARYTSFSKLATSFSTHSLRLTYVRVATNLENMENLENSGNLKNCQNLRENSGKLKFLWEKPEKLRENLKYVTYLPVKIFSSEFFISNCSGKNLKIPWKSQGKLSEFSFSKVWPPCMWCFQEESSTSS